MSSDIEDRRDDSGGGGFGFGGGGRMGMPMGLGGTVVLLILSVLFGRNFFSFFQGDPTTDESGRAASSDRSADRPRSSATDREGQFVSFVLDDVQTTWDRSLPDQAGVPYRHAKLVLFRDYTDSGCGAAQSATGPFYCPQDERVYIDLGFYNELAERFGAPGEFAQAYVLAHEIGHHVQKLLGTEGKVQRLQRANPEARNALSVRLELQADCYAGVWGHSTQQRNILEKGDVESGMAAAAAVGDDRLQRMSSGHVSPESFTHGSSAQRTSWFRRGLESGQVSDCNTFSDQ
jgi:predicted metalloprotease